MTSLGTHQVEYRLRGSMLGAYAECACCGAVGPPELAGKPCTWCSAFGHGQEWEQARAAEAATTRETACRS